MRTCNCTNQCPACGQCCQVNCGHRGGSGTWTAPSTSPHILPPVPVPVVPVSAPQIIGEVRLIPAPGITEEQVRRIVREALAEALEELRELKEGNDAA